MSVRLACWVWVWLPLVCAAGQGERLSEFEQRQERLQQERSLIEASFVEQEQACQSRFAVSACVKAARDQQRIALAPVRKQEQALQDEKRRQRSADQLQRLTEKAASRTADPSRLQKPLNKTPNGSLGFSTGEMSHLASEAGSLSGVGVAPDRQKRQQEKAQARSRMAAKATQNETEFQARVRDAARHKKQKLGEAQANGADVKPLAPVN